MGCCDLCGNYFDREDLRSFPMGTSSDVQACPGCAGVALRCAHADMSFDEEGYDPEDGWIDSLDSRREAIV